MDLNEKIMAALLALAVIGFFIAPCCWFSASGLAAKKIIPCTGTSTVAHDELKQQKKVEHEISKINFKY